MLSCAAVSMSAGWSPSLRKRRKNKKHKKKDRKKDKGHSSDHGGLEVYKTFPTCFFAF